MKLFAQCNPQKNKHSFCFLLHFIWRGIFAAVAISGRKTEVVGLFLTQLIPYRATGSWWFFATGHLAGLLVWDHGRVRTEHSSLICGKEDRREREGQSLLIRLYLDIQKTFTCWSLGWWLRTKTWICSNRCQRFQQSPTLSVRDLNPWWSSSSYVVCSSM